MKQILFFLIFSFPLIQSCANQELPDYSIANTPIVIDVDSAKEIPLKVGRIRYIPLETSEECLMANASKVLIRNDKIYVADLVKALALFVFDMNGKFLYKIARTGKGPGEYIYFKDFDIQTNGDIYIFDNHGRKILVFDQTGNFLRNIRLDYYFASFCLMDDKMYWSELHEDKVFANLAVYHMTDHKTEFLLTDKKFLYPRGITNFISYKFYYSPDATYYSPKFSEIIYSINEEGVHPAIGIKNLQKPSDQTVAKWVREKESSKRIGLITEGHQYFLENILIYETDKYITIGCRRGANHNTLLYNKHAKKAHTITFFDYFKTIGIDGIKGSLGNDFFSTVHFNPDNKFHSQILKSRKELANWKEEDNPVIVIFDLDV